jgi:Zn-dependent alcohol dehydrogenase
MRAAIPNDIPGSHEVMEIDVEPYLSGKLRLDELISARIGLDDVSEGYEALKRGAAARSVIVFPEVA